MSGKGKIYWGIVVGLGVMTAQAEIALVNGSFEEYEKSGRLVGWNCKGFFRSGFGYGNNGNGGLYWESASPSESVSSAGQEVPGIQRGDKVILRALVKKEGFRHSGYGAQVTLEMRDENGGWIAALYATPWETEDGVWTMVKRESVIPDNARKFSLNLVVAEGAQGKVWFDDVSVSVRRDQKPVGFVTSSAYQDKATGGNVAFHAGLLMPDGASGKAQATFVWRDANGSTVRTPATRQDDVGASVELDVGRFAEGTQTVSCELTAEGRKLGESSMRFSRVRELPERRVWIDEHQRCIVNGKPFFPIGMYCPPEPGMLAYLTNGVFNCIIHYKMPDRKMLDMISRFGLMSFASPDIKAAKDKLALSIAAITDHPALLGWYVGDEEASTQIGQRIEFYKAVRAADSDQHPAFISMERTWDLRGFVPTADVIGIDAYPVPRKPIRQVADFVRERDIAVFGSRANWGVPQAFEWTWYSRQDKKERFPTVAEMRSMIWQQILCGANGILTFTFRRETPPHWPAIESVHREVAERVPVLLSVEPRPLLVPSTKDIACRCWVKDGKLHLYACNLLEVPQKATVRVGAPYDRDITFDFEPIGVAFRQLSR